MSKIDLHIHSACSDDGELLPSEIMDRCGALGMRLAAITDHNSVRGVTEALALGKQMGIRVLSGVELDCTYRDKNFHLLGYGFDHTRGKFAALEEDILFQERQATEEKIHLFRQATGLSVSTEEVLAAAGGRIVTGELIGEILLSKEDAPTHELLRPYLPGGAKSDMPYVRFYWDFFSQGKPGYVPIRFPSLPEAKNLIHNAGGRSVLAHPGQNLKGDFSLLEAIIQEGIDGIEAFSSYHSAAEAAYFLEAARKHRLPVTCGSDFHGKTKPNIQLGGHGSTLEDQVYLRDWAN